jgi:hypothetical protein
MQKKAMENQRQIEDLSRKKNKVLDGFKEGLTKEMKEELRKKELEAK